MRRPVRLLAWASVAVGALVGFFRAGDYLVARSGIELVVPATNRGEGIDGNWQLFFDGGAGFVEEDSRTVRAAIPSGGRADLVFRLPPVSLRALRLDPPAGGVDLRLGDLRVLGGDGRPLAEITPDSFVAEGGLAAVFREGEGLLLRGGEGEPDPRVSLYREGGPIGPAWIGVVDALLLFFGVSVATGLAFAAVAVLVRKFGGGIRAFVFSFRVPFSAGPQSRGRAGRRIVLASAGLVAVVVAVLAWDDLTTPGLLIEDSHHYFNRYYGGALGPVDALGARPNGYYNIANNLYAWAVSHLDVRWQAGAYVAGASACFLVAVALPGFAPLVRDRRLLACLPPLLGLVGMNHVFYLTTLTFQMYVLILVLLALLFLPPPRTKAGLAGQCLLAGFLVFSGPYSVVAVPVALLCLLLFRHPTKRILWAVTAGCGFLYLKMTPGMARFDNLFDAGIVGKMVAVVFEDVFFLGVAGPFAPWKAVVFLLLAAPGVAVLARDRERVRVSLVFVALILLALTPLFLSRKFFFYPDPAPCHVLISQFFWIFLVVYVLDGLLGELRSPRLRNGLLAAVVATAAFFVVADSFLRPEKFHYDRARSVKGYLEAVHRAEKMGFEERNEFMLLSFGGDPNNPFGPRVLIGSREPDAERVLDGFDWRTLVEGEADPAEDRPAPAASSESEREPGREKSRLRL